LAPRPPLVRRRWTGCSWTEFDRITPPIYEPLGNGWTRVSGHMATHDVCHVGMRGVCTTAPFSDQDYQTFHRYHRTQGGIELPLAVGRLTVGHGQMSATCRCCPGNDDHACNNIGFGATVAHHDRMRVLAYVRCGEDEKNNAIWFSGVLAPEADERDLQVFGRQKVSGDWREVAGNMELAEILVLSRREPGFPLPRVSMENGRQRSLTAASPIGAIVERENSVTHIELGGAFQQVGNILGQAIGAAVADALDGFAFNPNQKRGPDGKWIKMGGKGSAGGSPGLPGRKAGSTRKSAGGGAGAGDDSHRRARPQRGRQPQPGDMDLGRQLTGTGDDFDEDDAEPDDAPTQLTARFQPATRTGRTRSLTRRPRSCATTGAPGDESPAKAMTARHGRKWGTTPQRQCSASRRPTTRMSCRGP
jgi:hypothetical protein